jgi:hypothetical protein
VVTERPQSRKTDDFRHRRGQGHFLPGEQVVVGHPLVTQKLAFPTGRRLQGVGDGQVSRLFVRGDAHGTLGDGVDAGGRHFTEVRDP